MKRIFWVLLVGFWFTFSIGLAYGADLSLRKTFNNYWASDLSNTPNSLEARLSFDHLFFYAEANQGVVRWAGQNGGDIDTFGIGFGLKHDFHFNDRFALTPWGKIGYCYTRMDLEDGPWTMDDLSKWECLWRKQEEIVGEEQPYMWDKMYFDLDNYGVGSSIGLDFSYQAWKNISIVLGAGISFLRTQYNITGRNNDSDLYWTANGNLNLSSSQAVLGLIWTF